MGVLRRVLAGLATGGGNYLIEKGKQDAQALRDQILMNRELALKKLEHDYRVAEGDKAAGRAETLMVKGHVQQRITDKNRGQIEGGNAAAADGRRESAAIRLERLRHSFTSGDKKRDQEFDKWMLDNKVVDTIQNKNGDFVGVTGTGRQVPVGVQGHLPEGADGIYPASSGNGSMLDAALNNGGGTAATSPTGQQDVAYDSRGVAYRPKNGKWVDDMGREYVPGS